MSSVVLLAGHSIELHRGRVSGSEQAHISRLVWWIFSGAVWSGKLEHSVEYFPIILIRQWYLLLC
jgi:hypothetical protein